MVEKSHTAGWLPQFYEPFQKFGQKLADWFAPRSDASALKDYYEINVELPGVSADNVDVSVHDGSLIVKGEKHYQHEETGRTYFFTEREYGSFQRTFRLPLDADCDNIDATFTDGVLCLKIAKEKPAKAKEKKVKVRKT